MMLFFFSAASVGEEGWVVDPVIVRGIGGYVNDTVATRREYNVKLMEEIYPISSGVM